MVSAQELLDTTDASVWAKGFMEVITEDGEILPEMVTEGMMQGWFANAMAAQKIRQDSQTQWVPHLDPDDPASAPEIAGIASITHEANRQYQRLIYDAVAAPWSDLSSSLRGSIIDGVRNKIRNPDVTPQDSHANWLAFKREEGYVYGPEKSEEKMTHPCVLPYDQLPAKDRKKDELFLAIVKVFG